MNSQKKIKFTVFDALVVLVIFALLGYVGYTKIMAPKYNGVSHKLEFVVQVPITTADIAKLVKEGDAVTVFGKDSAKVKKVEVAPAHKLVLDSVSGKYKNSPVPDKYDILVTLLGDATDTDREILLGKSPVRVGSSILLQGLGYSLNGYVFDMNLIDTEGGVTQ